MHTSIFINHNVHSNISELHSPNQLWVSRFFVPDIFDFRLSRIGYVIDGSHLSQHISLKFVQNLYAILHYFKKV